MIINSTSKSVTLKCYAVLSRTLSFTVFVSNISVFINNIVDNNLSLGNIIKPHSKIGRKLIFKIEIGKEREGVKAAVIDLAGHLA